MTRFSLIRHLIAAVLLVSAAAPAAAAGDLADARATLAKSVQVVEKVRSDKNFADWFDAQLARARAVLVVPSFYKGAFFIGGAYGNGVLTVRDDAGTFSPPAFLRIIGGSVGLQFGGQEGQLLFLIMTRKGLDAILQDQFKVGANIGVSFGTFGANMEAATTSNMDKDILVFGHARGAFGGGALEGASFEPRPEWNRAIYGQSATPKVILFDRRWILPEAEPLYQALATIPVKPGVGPAAQPADGSSGIAPPAPTAEAAPVAAPSYSASGETAPAGAPMAPSQTPSATPAPSSSGGPVRLVPVERQDLQ